MEANARFPQQICAVLPTCLADLLPEIERIIYLDTDIVVQGDIAKLYDLEFAKDQFIAGVNDMDSEELKEKISTSAYINSGVILFDLATIRRIKLNVVEESIKILQNFRERISLNIDQDLINIIFNDHIRLLDISWNAQSVGTPRGFKLGYDDKSIEKNIIHFIASINHGCSTASRDTNICISGIYHIHRGN